MPELRHFNPQPYPNGRVLYDIVTSTNDLNILQLHNFEPFRKEFIVVAIGTYEAHVDTEDIAHTLNASFPNAIVHNVILFDTPLDVIKAKVIPSDHSPKTSFYHHDLEVVTGGLDSILVEITRNYLHSLDNYVNSFTIVTLRSPVSEGKVLVKTIHKNSNTNQKRFSSGNFISSLIETKMKLQHVGRKNKVMGNFYLLAGKYTDAMNEFSEAILALKKCEDYLWLGSALEGMLITIALLQYIGANFQMPVLALTAALQISSKKLQSLASLDTTSTTRSSMDSIRSALSSSNSTPQVNIPNSITPRNSLASQRNSINGGELNDVLFPELFKLVYNKILKSYHLSTSDFENCIPDVILAEYILRATKFMIQIRRLGTEVTKSLTNLVNTPQQEESSKFYSREEILRELDNVYLIQLTEIDFVEQCNIYCVLASIYFELKAHRKQSFILRTLIVSLSRKLKEKPDSISESIKQMSREGGGNDVSSIYSLFEMLFEAYKVTSKPEENIKDAYLNLQGNWISLQILLLRLCMNVAEIMKDYPFLLKVCSVLLTRYTHCLPPNDQIRLKEMIDYSVFVSRRNSIELHTPYWDPFIVRDARLSITRSKNELLPFDEYEVQDTPLEGKTKAGVFDPYTKAKPQVVEDLLIVNEVYQLVLTLQNPFAFEIEINELKIVSEIEDEIQTLQHLTRPVVESNSIVSSKLMTKQQKTVPSVGIQNYKRPSNSSSSLNGGGSINNVSASPANISPLLQSTHAVTEDPSSLVKHHPTNLIIAPNSIQQFLVLFKSLATGEIIIKGFEIGLSNCRAQFFNIVESEFPSVLMKVKDLRLSESKPSTTGSPLSNIISNLENNNIKNRVLTKTITLNVLPPQPTLVLDSILITNGWLMLLEGERVTFSISLVNKSDVLINYLSFSFWDSTIEPLSKKLNQGYQTLTPAEMYEIEWFLLKSKPFSIVNKDEVANKFKTIPPHEKITIEYEIFCKRGIKELKIILDYSHRVASDTMKSYVKQFYIPIGISIMPTLEIIGFHLLPLFSNTLRDAMQQQQSEGILHTDNLCKLLKFIDGIQGSKTEDIYEYCLLVFDLRNNWNLKLHCEIGYKSTGFQINEEVEAGITTRYFLPIKRIQHNEVNLTDAIPSLRNKQFIKNYSISEAEDKSMRRLFWLREELLNNLTGSWASNAIKGPGTRYGDIQFRSIRLTEPMLDILLLPEIQMTSTIETEDGTECEQLDGKYQLTTEQFYILRTKIHNGGKRDIDGIFRHVPFLKNGSPARNQLSIDRRILFNGVMQQHLGQMIRPNQTIELQLSFTILEIGIYEWGMVLDLLNGETQEQVVGLEPITISAV